MTFDRIGRPAGSVHLSRRVEVDLLPATGSPSRCKSSQGIVNTFTPTSPNASLPSKLDISDLENSNAELSYSRVGQERGAHYRVPLGFDLMHLGGIASLLLRVFFVILVSHRS